MNDGWRQPRRLSSTGPPRVSAPRLLNPYRSVDQDHRGDVRRLGAAAACGCGARREPPPALRGPMSQPLSAGASASSAPINSAALANKASSTELPSSSFCSIHASSMQAMIPWDLGSGCDFPAYVESELHYVTVGHHVVPCAASDLAGRALRRHRTRGHPGRRGPDLGLDRPFSEVAGSPGAFGWYHMMDGPLLPLGPAVKRSQLRVVKARRASASARARSARWTPAAPRPDSPSVRSTPTQWRRPGNTTSATATRAAHRLSAGRWHHLVSVEPPRAGGVGFNSRATQRHHRRTASYGVAPAGHAVPVMPARADGARSLSPARGPLELQICQDQLGLDDLNVGLGIDPSVT